MNASIDVGNAISLCLIGKSRAVVMASLAQLLLQAVETDDAPYAPDHYRRLRRDLKLFTGELVCDSDVHASTLYERRLL